MVRAILWTMAAWLCALPAEARPQSLILAPQSAQIGFRAYGFGIAAIDGAFTRFNGRLIIDSADPSVCEVDIQADAASLQMPDPDMTQNALGADLLDVARYPVFAFTGICQDGQVRGTLSLHGVSRPLALDINRANNQWIATGRMRRAEWGMSARPLLVGPEVRIRFTAALPAALPAAQ